MQLVKLDEAIPTSRIIAYDIFSLIKNPHIINLNNESFYYLPIVDSTINYSIENGEDVDSWTYEELVDTVKAFRHKHKHILDCVDSEMNNHGFYVNQSDSNSDYIDSNKKLFNHEYNGDDPNIDNPKPSTDIYSIRTIKINNKMSKDGSDEDYHSGIELEPRSHDAIRNSLDIKSSTSTSQSGYEVIDDQQPSETILRKNKLIEEEKENMNDVFVKDIDQSFISKTDIGFSELSQLKKDKISAKVWDGKICKDGFFSFSYASYKIEIHSIGWTVRRKESDFIFLRKYLCTKYPQHFIPPLVLTSIKLSDASLIEKEIYFTRFLINVLRNLDLRGSYFLQEFLSIENQETFEKLVENRRLESIPQNLREYTTLHGKANTKSKTTTWQFWYNIPSFTLKYEELSSKISKASERLALEFNNVNETMQELSSYFNKLGNLYTDTDENIFEINQGISTLLSSWSGSFQSQGAIFNNWLHKFFNYNTDESKSINEMLEHRNITKLKLVKMQNELEQLKTKLYNDGDVSKWRLSNEDMRCVDTLNQDEYLAKSRMLPEQTQALNSQKLLLNYLNNTLETDIKSTQTWNYHDLKSHFLKLSDHQLKAQVDIQIMFSDFILAHIDSKESPPQADPVKKTSLNKF